MSNWRRFIVFFLLSFSFGGFFFYAGVVVPVGTSVLGATTQGFVTRLVTKAFNAATVVTALAVAVDSYFERKHRSKKANTTSVACLLLIASCSLLLITLHSRLDALLEPGSMNVEQPETFYQLHRIYLWTSTVQWAGSLPLMWILVNSSRAAQRMETIGTETK